MRRFCIGLAGLLLPLAAAADGRDSARTDCGGNSYSYVEVVPPGPRQRDPIFWVPDTLCADLAGNRAVRIDSLNIYLGNGGSQQPSIGFPRSPTPPIPPIPRY